MSSLQIAASVLVFAASVLLCVAALPGLVRLTADVRRAYRSGVVASERVDATLARLLPLLQTLGRYFPGPRLAGRRRRLDQLLAQAGAPNELTSAEVLSGSVICAVCAGTLGAGVFTGVLGMPLLFSVFVATGGLFLPQMWLQSYVNERLVAMRRQLPYMVDLVVMAMAAGAPFLEAIEIYIRESPDEALAGEWQLFLGEMRLGTTRREALQHLAERLDIDEIRTLAVTITQGEEMGTPLGDLLRVYADGNRLKRTQRAEKLAGEAGVRILGPTMMMMGAVVLMVLGPIIIRYVRGGFG